MQKNKFVHEDIKAVCNSATKKLIAMGVVAATTAGGPIFIGNNYKNIACAQEGAPNEHTEMQEIRKGPCWNCNLILCVLVEHDITKETFDDCITPEKLEKEIARLEKHKIAPETIARFKALMAPHVQRVYNNRRLDREYFEARNEANRLLSEANFEGNNIWQTDTSGNPSDIIREHANSTGLMVDRYHTLAERVRNNSEVLDNAAIDELINIHLAELNEWRQVTTPGSTIILQNGTEFTTGETREETINSLIDTIPDPKLSEQNTTSLSDSLKTLAKAYGLSGESLIAFLRKHVFRGG